MTHSTQLPPDTQTNKQTQTQAFMVSASPLLMHPKHKLSELLQCQMVLFTKAITIQIELEVVWWGRELKIGTRGAEGVRPGK